MYWLRFGFLRGAMALIERFGVDVCISDINGYVDGVYGFVGVCDTFVASFLLI